MTKAGRITYSILLITAIAAVLMSLYYPYLLKVNLHAGDPNQPKIINGSEFDVPRLVLALMFVSLLSVLFLERQVLLIVTSLLVPGFTYLTRISIHSQWNIDREYDTKTGFGYLILVVAAIVYSIICWIILIHQWRARKQNTQNTIES